MALVFPREPPYICSSLDRSSMIVKPHFITHTTTTMSLCLHKQYLVLQPLLVHRAGHHLCVLVLNFPLSTDNQMGDSVISDDHIWLDSMCLQLR